MSLVGIRAECSVRCLVRDHMCGQLGETAYLVPWVYVQIRCVVACQLFSWLLVYELNRGCIADNSMSVGSGHPTLRRVLAWNLGILTLQRFCAEIVASLRQFHFVPSIVLLMVAHSHAWLQSCLSPFLLVGRVVSSDRSFINFSPLL